MERDIGIVVLYIFGQSTEGKVEHFWIHL